MPSVRFSVLVLPNVAWPEFLRRCQSVEALGFDGLSLCDHLVDWAGGGGSWFELWTQTAAVAMATRRVRLATLVAQIPLRNPVQFAQQALTVDHISGGRLEVGLGTGLEIDPSYRMMGVENWSAKERVARFGEYVDLVGQVLEREGVSYRGRYYQTEGTALRPRPVQVPRPPMIVAAMGKVMLGHAARHADVWNSLSFAPTFADRMRETRGRIAVMEAHCAAIERDVRTLRRSFLMFDPGARGSDGAYDYYESVEVFERMAREIIGLGIDEVVLYYPSAERQRGVFERIARDVLPKLRTGVVT